MKRESQERAIRVMLSSILASDLTLEEIRSISHAFLYDRGLARDFGAALQGVVSDIESRRPVGQLRIDHGFDTGDETVDRILSIAKRKRMPRRDILSMIGMVSPDQQTRLQPRDITIEQMLREFLSMASEGQRHELLQLFETGRRGGDEYLHGIMKDR